MEHGTLPSARPLSGVIRSADCGTLRVFVTPGSRKARSAAKPGPHARTPGRWAWLTCPAEGQTVVRPGSDRGLTPTGSRLRRTAAETSVTSRPTGNGSRKVTAALTSGLSYSFLNDCIWRAVSWSSCWLAPEARARSIFTDKSIRGKQADRRHGKRLDPTSTW